MQVLRTIHGLIDDPWWMGLGRDQGRRVRQCENSRSRKYIDDVTCGTGVVFRSVLCDFSVWT